MPLGDSLKNTVIIFAALFVSAHAAAQKKPDVKPGNLPPLSENVTVAVTNLEVVVTDSKGNRVPGLKKEDFQVSEDGVPQPLSNFYAVSGGRTTLSDGSEVSLSEAPKATDKQAEEIPANLKAKYIIYVDNLNIHPLHRTRIFKTLFSFVDKAIGPNTEGMVVTFNRSLKVRQRFTSDKGIIIGALEAVMGESGGGTTLISDRQDALQKINESKSAGEAISIAKMSARSMDDDLRYTVDGLKNTLALLAGVEGRKVLIYISDGLPQTVGQELFDTIQTKYHQSGAAMESFTFDRSASYATIAREANAQGVTLYAIDASGLKVEEGVSAEYGTMQSRPSTFVLQQNYQFPLQMLAKETGGIAAVNTNNAEREFNEIARDFSDFYSLGYRSTRGAVDRPHSIEVRIVNHSGLHARYRSGYLEKTVETRTAESVTAALYYPRTDNPLQFSVAVGDPKPYSSANYLVPVRMSIPLQNVTLIPEGDVYRGRLYVYFVVLDSQGQQSDLQIRPIEIKVDGKRYDSARKKDYGYDVQLIMIPGGQKLSVAVRDGVSNSVSYAQKGVFVSVLPVEKKKSS
jgi:VWFA-related protein